MKSILKKTALVATLLALGIGAMSPKPAEALVAIYGIPSGEIDGRSTQVFAQVLVCIALLPLCILDQKIEGAPSVTSQDLADNGYSEKQIQEITEDFQRLQTEATEKKLRLEVRPDDTRESLAKDIRSIVPEASDTFVEFYTRQLMAR